MIPGSNNLAAALSVLGKTPVSYFQYSGRVTNAGGVMLTNYLAPVVIAQGSVQPVKRDKYEALGLDFAKRYIRWFVSTGVLTFVSNNGALTFISNNGPIVFAGSNASDLARDSSGDVIETVGRRWQLVGADDWSGIDGWKSLTGIDIGAATGALTNA